MSFFFLSFYEQKEKNVPRMPAVDPRTPQVLRLKHIYENMDSHVETIYCMVRTCRNHKELTHVVPHGLLLKHCRVKLVWFYFILLSHLQLGRI